MLNPIIFYSGASQKKIDKKLQDIKQINSKKTLTVRLMEKIDAINSEFDLKFDYPVDSIETNEDIIDYIELYMMNARTNFVNKYKDKFTNLENLKILQRTLELKFLICKYDQEELWSKDLLDHMENLQINCNKFIHENKQKDSKKIIEFSKNIEDNIKIIDNKYKVSKKLPLKSIIITFSVIIGCLCVVMYYSPKQNTVQDNKDLSLDFTDLQIKSI